MRHIKTVKVEKSIFNRVVGIDAMGCHRNDSFTGVKEFNNYNNIYLHETKYIFVAKGKLIKN